MAQEQLDDRTKQILKDTLHIAKTQDTFKAFANLESSGEPGEVVVWYSTLLRVCYFQEKNVALMTMVGRRGIQFGLEQANRTDSAKLADKLKATAKEISYNLGANTWPAWEDEGIAIAGSDLVVGLDAARTNLRLAIELKRDAVPMTDAHWLLGAHHLAAGAGEKAIDQFTQASEIAEKANLEDRRWMARGYVAISQQLNQATRAEGDKALLVATKKLRELGTDDAKYWADQLESVSRFFLNR